jgi:hypothetical protein
VTVRNDEARHTSKCRVFLARLMQAIRRKADYRVQPPRENGPEPPFHPREHLVVARQIVSGPDDSGSATTSNSKQPEKQPALHPRPRQWPMRKEKIRPVQMKDVPSTPHQLKWIEFRNYDALSHCSVIELARVGVVSAMRECRPSHHPELAVTIYCHLAPRGKQAFAAW